MQLLTSVTVFAVLKNAVIWIVLSSQALIDVAHLLQVGDIVSVIDMPPKELTTWWRGKHGFQVGTSIARDNATQIKAGNSAACSQNMFPAVTLNRQLAWCLCKLRLLPPPKQLTLLFKSSHSFRCLKQDQAEHGGCGEKAVGKTLTRKRQRTNLCFYICVYCAVFVFLVSGRVLAERFRWNFQNIPNIPGNYVPKLLCWNVTFLPKKELLFPSLDFLIKKFWEKQNPKATEGWGNWLSTSSLCGVSHFVSIHAGGIFTPPLLSVSRWNSEFAQERIRIDQPFVCFGLEIFSK